jgi:hypothetical protein
MKRGRKKTYVLTLAHHAYAVNTGGSSEAQRRELAALYRRRVAILFARAVLAGKITIRADELLRPMRLCRKRRSLQQEAVALLVAPLRIDGVLPRDFTVIW